MKYFCGSVFYLACAIGIAFFFVSHVGDIRGERKNFSLEATSTVTQIDMPQVPDITVTVTAYTSSSEETDDTPCIAADGSDICKRHAFGETICASNDYPFGTRLFLGGDVQATCTVADRMNKRYTGKGYVDLYVGSDTDDAEMFGVWKDVPLIINAE